MSMSMNLTGQTFGQYQLVQQLGKGGFAEVYLGKHLQIDQEVAIKVLSKQLILTQSEKFKKEASLIASLHHPNIIQLHTYDIYINYNITTTAVPYIVMDYAPNGSLRSNHPKGTCLAPAVIVSYVRHIAAALQYAHDRNILHLDVKPENILVGRQGDLLLSDFGLATILSVQDQSADIKGTLSYMAPEQLSGQPEFASDQYALGIMVYEWISGSVPFSGRTVPEVIHKHCHVPPPSLRDAMPSLSPSIEAVIMKALAKKASERYSSVSLFLDELEKAIHGSGRSTGGNTVAASPLQPPAGSSLSASLSNPAQQPSTGLAPTQANPHDNGAVSLAHNLHPIPPSPQPSILLPGAASVGGGFGTPMHNFPVAGESQQPTAHPASPNPPGSNSLTIHDPQFSMPPAPSFLAQQNYIGNGGNKLASQTSSSETSFQNSIRIFVEPKRGTFRRRKNLFIAGASANALAAIFIGMWTAQAAPSSQNETAWWVFIFSLAYSIGLFSLFLASGNKYLKSLLSVLLAFYWFIAGYGFATLIGAGNHITFLPGADVMSMIFLLLSLGIHLWMTFKLR